MECLSPCEISWCWTPGAPAFAADSTKYWWLGLLMAKKNFVKNYGFVILLFGLPGMANNNWYTRRRRWVCRIKICDLPQTRRAVFLLHTSARNTKTPCWNFHCWYSKLGSLHRKSSKKDWDVDIIFIKRMKNELKWTLSLGTARVLHVKKNSFWRQSIGIFFLQINDSR